MSACGGADPAHTSAPIPTPTATSLTVTTTSAATQDSQPTVNPSPTITTLLTMTPTESQTATAEPTPTESPQKLTFTAVSVGDSHSCGINDQGDTYCWGKGVSGQLGNGSMADQIAPVPVSGGLTFRNVSAGGNHTCGVTTDAKAYCWGKGASGQLGDGLEAPQTIPVLVSGGHTFQLVSAGGSHTCGVTAEGNTFCWGKGASGQLGNGSMADQITLLFIVNQIGRTLYIGAGGSHTCRVADTGIAYCWGAGASGQLGNDERFNSSIPVSVFGQPFSTSPAPLGPITAGEEHTCVIKLDGIVFCWGKNEFGQLGNGSAVDSLDDPNEVSGGITFQLVSAGGSHTCGVTTEGKAYCWGKGASGQLGDGLEAPQTIPVLVSGGHTFQSVSAGGSHTCGLTTPEEGGDVYCWGEGESGQLGNGSTDHQSTPVPVSQPE